MSAPTKGAKHILELHGVGHVKIERKNKEKEVDQEKKKSKL